MKGILLTEGATSTTTLFDNSVVDFIFTAVEKFLGLFTTNPALAIFLTIGIIGSVAGLTGQFISMARHSGH